MRLVTTHRARYALVFGGVLALATACGGEPEARPASGNASVRSAAAIVFARDASGRCFPCAMTIVTAADTLHVDSTAGVGLILRGGREVAFNGLDGAGGYENEGESIWIIDVSSSERRAVMHEYAAVREIREVFTADRRSLLVVRLEDGGAGMSAIAVIDPTRGQVHRSPRSLIAEVTADTLVLNQYDGEAPWTDPKGRDPATGLLRATPIGVTRLSLTALLASPVMENPRSPR